MEFTYGKTHSQLGGVYVLRRHISFSILSLLFLSGFFTCNLNATSLAEASALGIPQTLLLLETPPPSLVKRRDGSSNS